MINLEREVSLKPYNTFGIDVIAPLLLRIHTESDLQKAIRENVILPHSIILGGGSNILFTQRPDRLIIKNEILGKEVIADNEHEVLLRIGAGENWNELVLFCLDRNWGGIENLSLIPGCVGAAPIQNIGAYGVELEAVFLYLEAISLHDGSKHIFHKQACGFGYRDSIFKREAKGQYVICRVILRLTKKHHINTSYKPVAEQLARRGLSLPTIRDISDIIMGIRQSKLPDPADIGNAGSFFKNPVIPRQHFEWIRQEYPEVPSYPVDTDFVKVPAAWLIQTCGWKGRRWGNYGVHEKQALVLVNYGGACGEDLLDLSEKIQNSVLRTFDIELEREINVI